MSITAVVTNYNYGRFLRPCLDSALEFCDEVLVYDDGSTDESMEILSEYQGIKVTHRDDCSGGPVWGSDLGIAEASCTHLIYLDSDNVLRKRPSALEADYTFGNIMLINSVGDICGQWMYDGWPLDPAAAIDRYKYAIEIPVPWGGFWRVDWLRENDCKWTEWPSSSHAADWRTCIDWVLKNPTLAYNDEAWLCFRQHPEQESEKFERRKHVADDAYNLAVTL